MHAVRQGFVHRATRGDLRNALALCVVEVAFDVHVAGDVVDHALGVVTILAVVGVNAFEVIRSAD